MAVLTCNACNKEFDEEKEQKFHYKSEWHRYNLKRKVAGVPGVTEALFLARQAAVAEERDKLSEKPMSYNCSLCGKQYRSAKAHAQHINSRVHTMRACQQSDASAPSITIIKNAFKKPGELSNQTVAEESEDEWEEVDSSDDLNVASESFSQLNVDEENLDEEMYEDVEIDTTSCFVCDLRHDSIENCMIHMHKYHGFFIPDVEYLKDPNGLLTYVGLKVKRDFLCLYCNDRCHPFQSLEAVRKHMVAKAHCKMRFGDGGDDEEADYEEFYDYSSSYVNESGEQLVTSGEMDFTIELGSGGAELIITRKTGNKTSTRILGSREYLRYYRQKPRPSPSGGVALAASLASRYKSMGLSTVQSRENLVRLKVIREMNKRSVEHMRSKMGMKSNVIRNLPKNCTY